MVHTFIAGSSVQHSGKFCLTFPVPQVSKMFSGH